MAEIRRIVGTQIPADGEYLLLVRGRRPDTYMVTAQLENRAAPFPGQTVYGGPGEAEQKAQEIATQLGVPEIYVIG
jgi:hypothetical protein